MNKLKKYQKKVKRIYWLMEFLGKFKMVDYYKFRMKEHVKAFEGAKNVEADNVLAEVESIKELEEVVSLSNKYKIGVITSCPPEKEKEFREYVNLRANTDGTSTNPVGDITLRE